MPFGYYDFNYRLGLYYRVFGEESVKHFVLSKQAPDAAKIFSDLKGIPYQNRVQSNKTPKKNQLLRFLVLNRWFSEISKNHQKNIIWRVLNKVLNVVYK